MNPPLQGRTALVTGASRGIGLAIARRLAGAGARLAIVARGEPELNRLAQELAALPVPGDLSSAAGAAAVARRAARELGSAPDFLVNAAGSFLLAPAAETDPADFELQLAVNLTGPFHLIRAFLPEMLARGSGHVMSIGSVAGRVALPGNAAYSASKFGLRGLHEVLAVELQGSGVRSTLVEPSATDTSLWDALDPDARADLPSRAQMLSPDDVARAALFVLSQPEGVELTTLALRSGR